ncbi:glycosyltransferase family 2 protein [Lachnospiraceae bacterium 45-P1]
MSERIIASCIVLCYKDFDNIYKTIDSILKQNYEYVEIIISDDGSTNFPETEIRNYIRDKRQSNICNILIIHHDENIGTVKNFNCAIEQAKGKYIIPVSCNDELNENDALAKIIDRFKKTSANLLICRRQLIKKGGKEQGLLPTDYDIKQIESLQTSESQYFAFASQLYYDMASGSCTYYDRDFLMKRGLFDTSYRLWEDGPLYLQYTREGNKITTAYDIISCKYLLGGVSTGNVVNSQLRNDYFIMIKKEVIPYINRFKWLDRRKVKYISVYSLNREIWSKTIKIIYTVLYLDAYLYRRVMLNKRYKTNLNLFKDNLPVNQKVD